MKEKVYRVGIGQDSHRFLPQDFNKPCTICGLIFDSPGLSADSDGDVVFHAICNAITSITNIPILGGVARELCKKDGITDSEVYLKRALETLNDIKIVHIALAIEGKRPYFQERIDEMREKLAAILAIDLCQVGITVTSGDGLTDFGCGEGLQCFCVLTTTQEI